MPHDILVYSEFPASIGSLLPSLQSAFPKADYTIKTINSADIKNGILSQPQSRLLVLPGVSGESSRYTAQIDKTALDNIHDFVTARQNVLLSICAGTYFICRETIYAPAWGPTKTKQSLRPLFNASARGPVVPHGIKPDPQQGLSDVEIVPIRFKDQNGSWRKTGICYGNGPGLYPDTPNHPDTEILAVYDRCPDMSAALIRHRTGAGAIYLSSILPEIGYHNINPQSGLTHAITLMNALQPHEMGRRALWQDLTNRIKKDLA